MDPRELEVSMLPRPVHFCITIHILALQFWTIIVGLVLYIVTCLQEKLLDVVTPQDFQ